MNNNIARDEGFPGGPGRVQAGSLVCNPGIEAKFYTLLQGHAFYILHIILLGGGFA